MHFIKNKVIKLGQNQYQKSIKNKIWFMTFLILINSILMIKSLMSFPKTKDNFYQNKCIQKDKT